MSPGLHFQEVLGSDSNLGVSEPRDHVSDSTGLISNRSSLCKTPFLARKADAETQTVCPHLPGDQLRPGPRPQVQGRF